MFDAQHGGFGGAPKFPRPPMMTLAAARWHASSAAPEPDLQALYMATLTLRRMADGGINDQLGGGFCRYAVDEFWMIPHFEKMLYDNGELLAAYAQAALATGDADYARIAEATAAWTLREMQAPRRAATTRASMRIPRATRASSTPGSARKWRRRSARRSSPVRAALRARPARQLRGQVAPVRGDARWKRSPRPRSSRPRRRRAARRAARANAARAARHARAPGA